MRVVGLPEVMAGLAAKAAEIDVAAAEGRLPAAERIKAAWTANIESEGLILTGHYLDSVTVTPQGSDVLVHSDVEYASILEYGDSRQAAHYPATRAFDEHHGEVTDEVGDAVRRAVR